jgi:hypothetical protein
MYEAVNDAVCCARASRPMGKEWKRNVERDYKKRNK